MKTFLKFALVLLNGIVGLLVPHRVTVLVLYFVWCLTVAWFVSMTADDRRPNRRQ